MLGALGTNVAWLYTGMFVLAAFLAGLSGALVTPIKSVVPGMDIEIIVEAFIVVVIGGLGSLWGTLLGALIYGQVLSFGILIFPRFSIFAVFVLMAVVLIVRPWGLLGRPDASEPVAQARIPWTLVLFLIAALRARWLGSRYYTFLATDIVDLRAVRHEPESAAGHHRPGLLRPCRLFRHRRLRLRHPDEGPGRAVPARLARRRRWRRAVRAPCSASSACASPRSTSPC